MKIIIRRDRKPIPRKRRLRIYRRDGYTCRYCGHGSHILHIDHIKPIYWGGSDFSSNLVTACADCNMEKGASLDWQPNPIPFWRHLYSLWLQLIWRDFPRLKDYI